jgi:hypothetical protein
MVELRTRRPLLNPRLSDHPRYASMDATRYQLVSTRTASIPDNSSFSLQISQASNTRIYHPPLPNTSPLETFAKTQQIRIRLFHIFFTTCMLLAIAALLYLPCHIASASSKQCQSRRSGTREEGSERDHVRLFIALTEYIHTPANSLIP